MPAESVGECRARSWPTVHEPNRRRRPITAASAASAASAALCGPVDVHARLFVFLVGSGRGFLPRVEVPDYVSCSILRASTSFWLDVVEKKRKKKKKKRTYRAWSTHVDINLGVFTTTGRRRQRQHPQRQLRLFIPIVAVALSAESRPGVACLDWVRRRRSRQRRRRSRQRRRYFCVVDVA